MDHEKIVEVYTTGDANQAEILKGALAAEGIEAMIEGETQGGFTGLTTVPVKIYVHESDADRARAYLKKHDH
ncbi:putative signal transducing protein [Lignipirellula cremea]|uniref:DUF2007 domain-containing protein n=1 Tax=Lignipirellula cremea TaxID=2528010 RepID=A0A518DQT0_9BACT|nr:DUF2007 domain-containing protein [Lignipirellula cremea]QDU94197.1 hypothetical protein Pla8534_19850 [Lignipirellula cremea]